MNSGDFVKIIVTESERFNYAEFRIIEPLTEREKEFHSSRDPEARLEEWIKESIKKGIKRLKFSGICGTEIINNRVKIGFYTGTKTKRREKSEKRTLSIIKRAIKKYYIVSTFETYSEKIDRMNRSLA